MKKRKPITKPNIKNEDPEYWEKVLKSHGLGERQLGLSQVNLTETKYVESEVQ